MLRNEINHFFELKQDSIGIPSKYLGGKLMIAELENGQKCWAFRSKQYVEASVQNVVDYLKKRCESLPRKCVTSISAGYRPELDTSGELKPEDAAYCHSLVSVLRWIVELGRIDINVEVSMLSSHLALPREGHFDEILHIFGYL